MGGAVAAVNLEPDDKRVMRRTLLALRTAIPGPERRALAEAVCQRVRALDVYRAALHLAVYETIGAEIDPEGVVSDALSSGKSVYYPCLVGDTLEFVPRGDATAGGRGAFAWACQGRGARPAILVPGVGFDEGGVRLGRGGGHYDRALAAYPAAVRVGVACEAQVVPRLPREAWDVPMDFIVTEARVIRGGDPARRVHEETSS